MSRLAELRNLYAGPPPPEGTAQAHVIELLGIAELASRNATGQMERAITAERELLRAAAAIGEAERLAVARTRERDAYRDQSYRDRQALNELLERVTDGRC